MDAGEEVVDVARAESSEDEEKEGGEAGEAEGIEEEPATESPDESEGV
jgi:hypothetical protein